ncbi:MAG TPA: AraC family transcriptional regulator [Ktedonobacteraceae bacterium]|nr:AraC family transcriptional regulator [Ktedonobacteraceae bacterium]
MDVLADILGDLRLSSSFYARSKLRAPWGLSFSVQDGPSFHLIVTGRGFLRIDAERIPLEAGDLVLLPHGEEHQLAGPPESTAIPLAALPSERIGQNAAILCKEGDGAESLLICGGVRFAGPIAHPLLELLPRILLLHREELEGAHAWLDATLTLLGAEALSLRPGSAAVMTRLADILVLQIIRVWLERDGGRRPGWLGALSDPDIGHALALIHRHAEEPWTVATLAREVHLSRSVFAERFSRLVGMSPMQYVTRWHMSLASSWLREERLSASEAAHRLGYSSEAAFSRAFKRYLQVPPGVVRRGM